MAVPKINLLDESQIQMDIAEMARQFKEGKPVGDPSRIPSMSDSFSWKKSFVNCWTGWPNDGKSTFFMFMSLLKAIADGWKVCAWSPEMYSAKKDEKTGRLKMTAEDLLDELVYMMTGKNPYKHFQDQHGMTQMPLELYLDTLSWLEKQIIFIHPKDRKYTGILDNFRYYQDKHGFDIFLIDPFKNIDHSEEGGGRFDLYLDKVFSDFKEFSLETNTSLNIIAHPKNQVDAKNPDGSFKVCSQFMLAGGAAWNNSMDGIYSIYRPFKHNNPTDPRVSFINLKQRKQQLVGRVGVYSKIEFDWQTNRYYFDERCPIDGERKESMESIQKRKQADKQQAAVIAGEVPKSGRKSKGKAAQPEMPIIDFSEQIEIETGDDHDEHKPAF